jgi:hypothetical protein
MANRLTQHTAHSSQHTHSIVRTQTHTQKHTARTHTDTHIRKLTQRNSNEKKSRAGQNLNDFGIYLSFVSIDSTAYVV